MLEVKLILPYLTTTPNVMNIGELQWHCLVAWIVLNGILVTSASVKACWDAGSNTPPHSKVLVINSLCGN